MGESIQGTGCTGDGTAEKPEDRDWYEQEADGSLTWREGVGSLEEPPSESLWTSMAQAAAAVRDAMEAEKEDDEHRGSSSPLPVSPRPGPSRGHECWWRSAPPAY